MDAFVHPEFRFTCEGCGEPWAHQTGKLIDVHGGGAIVYCADCGQAHVVDIKRYDGPSDGTGHPA